MLQQEKISGGGSRMEVVLRDQGFVSLQLQLADGV